MLRSKLFVASGLVAPFAAVLAVNALNPPSPGTGADVVSLNSERGQIERGPLVNRSGKGDRAPFASSARSHEKQQVASVEVVGIGEAAIVYRDGNGQILFSINPATNTTVAAKDVLLPQVTLRETERPDARPLGVKGSHQYAERQVTSD